MSTAEKVRDERELQSSSLVGKNGYTDATG